MVCVFHQGLGAFDLYKITNNGQVSKSFAPVMVFAATAQEAFRRLPVPFAGFSAVSGVDKDSCPNWNTYVEQVWKTATA